MVTKFIIIVWTTICLLGGLFSVLLVDTALDKGDTLVAGIFGASFFLWFAVWSAIVIPTALVGLLFKKQKH